MIRLPLAFIISVSSAPSTPSTPASLLLSPQVPGAYSDLLLETLLVLITAWQTPTHPPRALPKHLSPPLILPLPTIKRFLVCFHFTPFTTALIPECCPWFNEGHSIRLILGISAASKPSALPDTPKVPNKCTLRKQTPRKLLILSFPLPVSKKKKHKTKTKNNKNNHYSRMTARGSPREPGPPLGLFTQP